MRTLFLLLILANAGFFAWQYSLQPTDTRPAAGAALPPIPGGVKQLRLLDEKAQGGAGSTSAATAPGQSAAHDAVASAPQTAAPLPAPQTGRPMAGTTQTDRRSGEVPGGRQQTAAPTAGATQTAASGAGDGASPSSGLAAEPTSPLTAADATPAPTCYLIGRFPSAEQAHAAVDLFKGEGLEAEFSMREQQTVYYWVHTPVQPSHAAALGLIHDLNAKGLRDVAVVQTGDWKDSVSLGYYANQTSADTRLTQARRLGLDAATDTQQQSTMTYWVRYQALADQGAADHVWRGLAAAHPKLQREGTPCR